MELFDRRAAKEAARESLDHANSPHKVVLMHTGAVLVLTLVLTVVNYLLEKGIASTGGLGGMGTRAILETLQQMLSIAQMVFLPFWQIGYSWYCLRVSRQEAASSQDLLQGFRKFGPVLRLNLFKFILFFAVAMVCSYVVSLLFLLTPWAKPLQELLAQMAENPSLMEDSQMTAAMEQVVVDSTVPLLILFLVVYLPLCAPLYYQYRMAEFCLLDAPEIGALAALRDSRDLTRGARVSLLKLDLSFWWFYLLDGLVSAVCYGDLVLDALGVDLGFGPEFAYFFFLIVYIVCQLGLYLWRRNQVSVTYAHVYGQLQGPRPQPQPVAPGKQPWNY